MAELLKGMEVANGMKQRLIDKNNELIAKGVVPCLAIVRVGGRPDDLAYERGALKRFEGLGIRVKVAEIPESATQEAFEREFSEINGDPSVHGILLFRPLPKSLDEEPVKKLIDPEKDVDCMCAANIAKVFMGDDSGYAPCTPQAVVELLKHYEIPLAGAQIALIGRSMVVGKPLAMLLLKENATVTLCHSKTVNLPEVCQRADIVVAAAGSAKMVTKDFVRPGAVVIDVGINDDGAGGICGDVAFDEAEAACGAITPVPGGVGSVTTSVLAMNTLKAAERALLRPGGRPEG
ncbi:MAG: bifunctional 5,10-methylenetetrahydrofolate dehydrogenase/5,10-methenyltetrahydrofolate cyclohydrolase [Clostridiales bacterium]|nr:bifunctional 5,10-methylenetetrahydrofolate dehydrogenase/5,10-methenyltetrahydrofolate cyclohydrolase [Clostridiales bacterium]